MTQEARGRRPAVLLLTRDISGPSAPPRLLAAAGYQVHVAADPADARRLLFQHPTTGIVVLDLHNAAFQGTEVYAGLCQCLPRDRELAAIFLARSPSVNDVVRALRLGATDLLRAPVQPEHLLDAAARAGTLHERRTMLYHAAATAEQLAVEMRVRAAALLEAARRLPPTRAPVDGAVEFVETLDWQAQHEDTSSLAYTKRQRRQLAVAVKAQALRREVIADGLTDDFACWDMLLDLHGAVLSGRSVSVSNLCGATRAPATTALRRLEQMVEAGLVTRTRDPTDRRRVFVCLTETATQRLRNYFDAASPL